MIREFPSALATDVHRVMMDTKTIAKTLFIGNSLKFFWNPLDSLAVSTPQSSESQSRKDSALLSTFRATKSRGKERTLCEHYDPISDSRGIAHFQQCNNTD